MAGIGTGAIMSKLQAFANTPKGKRMMDEAIDRTRKGSGITAGGSKVLTEMDMHEAAGKLLKMVNDSAKSFAGESGSEGGIPPSVLNDIETLDYIGPFKMSDGSYKIALNFFGDIHRNSLSDDYSGVDNIIALFNNGYSASNYVYGFWDGHGYTGGYNALRSGPGDGFAYVRSRKDRPALHFMQMAVSDFNGNYGSDYNAIAYLSDKYK